MHRRINRIQALLSGTCHVGAEGAPSGGGDGISPGGGESGGGGGGSTDAGGSPSPEASGGFGGASEPSADHRFPATPPPTAEHTARVRGLLDQDPDKPIGMQDISDLLNFNTLFKKEEPKPAAGAAPPVPPAPPAAPPPPPAQTQTPLSPDAQAIVDALKTAATTPTQTPTDGTKPPEQPKQFYGGIKPAMAINQQIAQDLFGEDPQKQYTAMNTLVMGMMNTVMQDVASLIQASNHHLMQQIPQIATQQYEGRSNTEKFFSSFPELNKPALHGTVQAVAQYIVQQKTKAGQQPTYNEELIKEIGEAVHQHIERQLGVRIQRGAGGNVQTAPPAAPKAAATQSPPAPPAPNGAGGQPWMTPGGSRPPAGPGASGKSAELMNLVL